MNMKTFVIDQKLNYQECCRQGEYVNKYYEIEQSNSSLKFNTIPDACVDLQFAFLEGKAVICACGSFLSSACSPSSEYQWCFGVKFNPGKYPQLVSEHMDHLIEGHVIMEEYDWLKKIGERITKAGSFEDRIRIFEECFPFESQFSWMSSMVVKAMEMIEQSHGCINISGIAEELQYNQRYMDRVFRRETGLSMKKFATIIQIQTAIRYLQEERIDEVYEKLGYYDQSYFIKKFRKYTSMTPREYCKKIGPIIV